MYDKKLEGHFFFVHHYHISGKSKISKEIFLEIGVKLNFQFIEYF